MNEAIYILAPIVLFSFTIQAMTGFGSIVIALTIAALFLPIPELLPVLVALNLPLCLWVVTRQFDKIDFKLLLAIFPVLTLGVLGGVLLTPLLDGPVLKKVFGTIVVLFALREIYLLIKGRDLATMSATEFQVWMSISGLVHGLYASGGPPLVYAVGRRVQDKGVFRASLMFVWLIFNIILFGIYLYQGRFTTHLAIETCILMITIPIGLWAGEILHHRVPDKPFRMTIQVTLVLAGAALVFK